MTPMIMLMRTKMLVFYRTSCSALVARWTLVYDGGMDTHASSSGGLLRMKRVHRSSRSSLSGSAMCRTHCHSLCSCALYSCSRKDRFTSSPTAITIILLCLRAQSALL